MLVGTLLSLGLLSACSASSWSIVQSKNDSMVVTQASIINVKDLGMYKYIIKDDTLGGFTLYTDQKFNVGDTLTFTVVPIEKSN
jgi:hypothetical protein